MVESSTLVTGIAVLATLDEFGPASQAELSSRIGIYRSDLVAVINELADRGLVEGSPDPAERAQLGRLLTALVNHRGRSM